MSALLLRRGDVVLARFPYTDLSGDRVRPAVIVSVEESGPEYIMVFIASMFPSRPGRFESILHRNRPEVSSTGLRLPSVFRANRAVTLSRILVARRLGQVGPRIAREVDVRLRGALGL